MSAQIEETAPEAAPTAPASAPGKPAAKKKKKKKGPSTKAKPASAEKKKQKKKKKGKGPGKYSQLVIDAIQTLGDRNGSSLFKIYNEAKKVSWFDQQHGRVYLRYSIRALLQNDTLVQVKGLGANGSFKLNKKKFTSGTSKSSGKPGKAAKPAKKPGKKAAEKKKQQRVSGVKKATPAPAKKNSKPKKVAAKKASKPKKAQQPKKTVKKA